MNNSKHPITCAQVKEIDLVDWLAAKGHYPQKIRNSDYWYLSPLRIEETASFKVNRRLNCWYDHGLGKGGTLVDFAILYYNCTIAEMLQIVHGTFFFQKPAFHPSHPIITENKIKILGDFMLSSLPLLNYLKHRRILYEIAGRFCREVRYSLTEKIYYSIGFKNDEGGFEMRNRYCKNCSTPKAITTIKSGAKKIAVFEGFFDFLSFLVLCENQGPFNWDFCVLNSLCFFERTQSFLEHYQSIHLFLDTDEAGQKCSFAALKSNAKYIDESNLYKNYKYMNEWLMMMGKYPNGSYNNTPP